MECGFGIMICIALCDNDASFLKIAKQIIEKYMLSCNYAYSIDLYQSGKDLLQEISKLEIYDLIFLDVDMPEKSGLDVAREIRKTNNKITIAFITAYINYAIDGYKVNAIRYIIKDNSTLQEALQECMDVALMQKQKKEATIQKKFREGTRNIYIEDIIYAESYLHLIYFHVYVRDEIVQFTLYDKMDELEQQLGGFDFLRIHKSYLINLKYVQKVDRYQLTTTNDMVLPIGQTRYNRVREAFLDYCGRI